VPAIFCYRSGVVDEGVHVHFDQARRSLTRSLRGYDTRPGG